MITFRLDRDNPPKLTPAEEARLAAMSDEEIHAAAMSDPDNPPLTPEQLERFRRVGLARHVRLLLGLSREAFAERFHLPVETIRDWELHRAEPDAAARVLLQVIARDPEAVAKALEPV